MKNCFLGLDLGGTNVHAGLVTKQGEMIKEMVVPTEAWKGREAVVKNIVRAISPLMKSEPKGIGIGAPDCDYTTGKLVKCVNIPMDNFNIVSFVKKKFHAQVKADNDANCFALGESMFGAGKNYKHIVGITIGTGFGSGIIINKEVYHGKGKAGELGQITINYSGPKCSCGNIGCVEEYVSARAITRAYGENKTPLEVRNLALEGDEKAIKVFEDFGFYLGVSLVSIVNAFDPEIVVIGGNIAKSWDLFSQKMFETFNERKFLDTKIVRSKLKNAGLLGAAALFF